MDQLLYVNIREAADIILDRAENNDTSFFTDLFNNTDKLPLEDIWYFVTPRLLRNSNLLKVVYSNNIKNLDIVGKSVFCNDLLACIYMCNRDINYSSSLVVLLILHRELETNTIKDLFNEYDMDELERRIINLCIN